MPSTIIIILIISQISVDILYLERIFFVCLLLCCGETFRHFDGSEKFISYFYLFMMFYTFQVLYWFNHIWLLVTSYCINDFFFINPFGGIYFWGFLTGNVHVNLWFRCKLKRKYVSNTFHSIYYSASLLCIFY